jgi:hypothetical protein
MVSQYENYSQDGPLITKDRKVELIPKPVENVESVESISGIIIYRNGFYSKKQMKEKAGDKLCQEERTVCER